MAVYVSQVSLHHKAYVRTPSNHLSKVLEGLVYHGLHNHTLATPTAMLIVYYLVRFQ